MLSRRLHHVHDIPPLLLVPPLVRFCAADVVMALIVSDIWQTKLSRRFHHLHGLLPLLLLPQLTMLSRRLHKEHDLPPLLLVPPLVWFCAADIVTARIVSDNWQTMLSRRLHRVNPLDVSALQT
ncbi:uncharacterized protein LOC121758514 [Salvia splendens]|uniref:uncharacterized protein LOC121758514 n=1 Tax=Salvia splendens TaxID=180675 RepID=UPI001C27C99C|nr:uncharacterized protein LOC121758514 [Salvia splendens]